MYMRSWLLFNTVVLLLIPCVELLSYTLKPIALKQQPSPAKALKGGKATTHPEQYAPSGTVAAKSEMQLQHKPVNPVARCFAAPGLSKTALAAYALFFLWQALVIALPLKSYLENNPDSAKMHFAEQYVRAHPDYKPSETMRVISSLGAMAMHPLLGCFAVLLLPVSRTSSLLNLVGLSFEESVRFHKVAAYSAVVWMLVHGLCTSMPAFSLPDKSQYALVFWNAKSNQNYFAIWGQIAALIQLPLFVLAIKWVRQRFYWVFRASHLLFVLVLMFATAHVYFCFFWFQIGMTLIMCDAAMRCTVALTKGTAHLHASDQSAPHKLVTVQVAASLPESVLASMHLPGRFFYVQVPQISVLEWHPMSVCEYKDGCITFAIAVTAQGRWTQALHAYARQIGPDAACTVNLEGPYGYDWCSSASERLRAGGKVALVAGGSGVAPLAAFLSNMAHSSSSADQQLLRSVNVVWAVRDERMVSTFAPTLRAAAACGADIQVHCTGTCDASTAAAAAAAATAAGTSAALLAAPEVKAMPAEAQERSLLSCCKPASPLWRWCVGATMLWLATLGSAAGFILGRAACGRIYGGIPPSELTALAEGYNATVLATYAELYDGALPPGGWPEGQAPFESASLYEQYVFNHRDTVMYCALGTNGEAVDTIWDFGQPAPCANNEIGRLCPGFSWSIFSWLFAFLAAAAAGALFKRQRNSVEYGAAKQTVTVHNMPFTDRHSSSIVKYKQGRPDFTAFFLSTAASSDSSGSAAVATDVYVCGSQGLQQSARVAYDATMAASRQCGGQYMGLAYVIGQ